MIKEYQAEVIAAALVFEKYKGFHPTEAKRDGPEQMGYLDPEQTIYYYFHGMGLCIIFPDRRIDWEFDLDNNLDKFDLWRLWIFATEGTNKFTEFREEETLKAVFNEALLQGIIQMCPDEFPQEQLYYLSGSE